MRIHHMNGAGNDFVVMDVRDQFVALSPLAVELCRRTGADGLLVVTPYYNKANQQGLIRHYQVIADTVNSPVILYNVPSRTGVNISPESYAELAKHPNIIGTKEAGGNLSNIQKYEMLQVITREVLST